MEWQFHPSFGLSYHKSLEFDPYYEYEYYINYLIIGPLQIRWYSIK